MAAREGPVIDGEYHGHVFVINGARPADEVFDEADEEEVEDGSDDEIG